MNIWVVSSYYESELYASTHLTKKGAYLQAVTELYECMNIDNFETMEEFWEEYGFGEDDDKPEWCPYDLEMLRALSSEQLCDQYGEMCEIYWEIYDWGDRVELEVIHTRVAA
tara:strand:+ start:890 stop:1225 length:336 start_codon:yes stop_codon:yes gene_type:complete